MRGWRERENDEPRNTGWGEEWSFHHHSFQDVSFCKPEGEKRPNRYFKTIISHQFTAAGGERQDERLKSERERNGRSRKAKKEEEEGGC